MRTEKTYLDRDLVLGCFTDWVDRHGDVYTPDEMPEYQRIEALPAADVRENRRGHWIPVTNGRGGYECDRCHRYAPSYQDGVEHLSDYCPWCGADMKEDRHDTD